MSYCSEQTPTISKHPRDSVISVEFIVTFIGQLIFHFTSLGTLVRKNSWSRRRRLGINVKHNRRRKASADTEKKPSGVGTMKPSSRTSIPSNVPRSFTFEFVVMMKHHTAGSESVAAARSNRVPYRSSSTAG
uniref:Transmembrane protein n=1 Tax=Medicago truncatula TaxID=3880 RepID=I3SHZ0_MEDTR|nr:unknown [Medicago truncatula]